jgi:phosphate transport system protein
MVHFDYELRELKNRLLTMASHTELAVKRAISALENRDYELALQVRSDDVVIDDFEVEVDEMAIRLLAKAPLARDLRFIAVTMKISQNLERVGDEAAKIAKRARDLSEEPPLKLRVDIPALADLVLGMLKNALDAFVDRNPGAARALIPHDQQVDALNKEIHRQLANEMINKPDTITRCLNFMVVAKSLERIADHAKNMAEEVVFLCDAEDIRHSRKLHADLLPHEGGS